MSKKKRRNKNKQKKQKKSDNNHNHKPKKNGLDRILAPLKSDTNKYDVRLENGVTLTVDNRDMDGSLFIADGISVKTPVPSVGQIMRVNYLTLDGTVDDIARVLEEKSSRHARATSLFHHTLEGGRRLTTLQAALFNSYRKLGIITKKDYEAAINDNQIRGTVSEARKDLYERINQDAEKMRHRGIEDTSLNGWFRGKVLMPQEKRQLITLADLTQNSEPSLAIYRDSFIDQKGNIAIAYNHLTTLKSKITRFLEKLPGFLEEMKTAGRNPIKEIKEYIAMLKNPNYDPEQQKPAQKKKKEWWQIRLDQSPEIRIIMEMFDQSGESVVGYSRITKVKPSKQEAKAKQTNTRVQIAPDPKAKVFHLTDLLDTFSLLHSIIDEVLATYMINTVGISELAEILFLDQSLHMYYGSSNPKYELQSTLIRKYIPEPKGELGKLLKQIQKTTAELIVKPESADSFKLRYYPFLSHMLLVSQDVIKAVETGEIDKKIREAEGYEFPPDFEFPEGSTKRLFEISARVENSLPHSYWVREAYGMLLTPRQAHQDKILKMCGIDVDRDKMEKDLVRQLGELDTKGYYDKKDNKRKRLFSYLLFNVSHACYSQAKALERKHGKNEAEMMFGNPDPLPKGSIPDKREKKARKVLLADQEMYRQIVLANQAYGGMNEEPERFFEILNNPASCLELRKTMRLLGDELLTRDEVIAGLKVLGLENCVYLLHPNNFLENG